MFIDLRKYSGPAEIDTGICIVGAGVAGITLALELEVASRDIYVLESGSLMHNAETQSINSSVSSHVWQDRIEKLQKATA